MSWGRGIMGDARAHTHTDHWYCVLEFSEEWLVWSVQCLLKFDCRKKMCLIPRNEPITLARLNFQWCFSSRKVTVEDPPPSATCLTFYLKYWEKNPAINEASVVRWLNTNAALICKLRNYKAQLLMMELGRGRNCGLQTSFLFWYVPQDATEDEH